MKAILLQVRHDCEELAGSSSPEDNHDKLLQDLETEEKGIRAKVLLHLLSHYLFFCSFLSFRFSFHALCKLWRFHHS